MKVLTFSWEYPPVKTGGLGVACQGLIRRLSRIGIDITLVLPRKQAVDDNFCNFLFATDCEQILKKQTKRFSYTGVYSQAETFLQIITGYKSDGTPIIKNRTFLEEVYSFAYRTEKIVKKVDFDLIHAHDWTSYLAGVTAKMLSGKPLILHVHATSFDQAGGDNVDPEIYKIEYESFKRADKIITVSEYTKNMIINKHGVNPKKIVVIHNGCEWLSGYRGTSSAVFTELKRQGKKIVLYHGRISIQKGVDYFVRAARLVIDVDPNVLFIISGSGDMMNQIIDLVGRLRLSEYVKFAGPLWGKERDEIYHMADLLVMPSVSEPFGLVPLEALQYDTPTIISKQSGVAEVLTHTLKADFWDTEELANKILAGLKYKTLHRQLVVSGKEQIRGLSWEKVSEKVKAVYKKLV